MDDAMKCSCNGAGTCAACMGGKQDGAACKGEGAKCQGGACSGKGEPTA